MIKKIACVVTPMFVTPHILVAYLLTMQTSCEIASCWQASSWRLLDDEAEGTQTSQNLSNYLPVGTV